MKLKKDIQVKAFLIRNKIPFQRFEGFILVNEDRLGELNEKLLQPYLYKSEYVCLKRGPKPAKVNIQRVYKQKKVSVAQLLNLEPEPEKQPETRQRPPSIYSNNPYNS